MRFCDRLGFVVLVDDPFSAPGPDVEPEDAKVVEVIADLQPLCFQSLSNRVGGILNLAVFGDGVATGDEGELLCRRLFGQGKSGENRCERKKASQSGLGEKESSLTV